MPAHYLMRKTGRKIGAGIPDKDHFLLDFLEFPSFFLILASGASVFLDLPT